MGVPRLAFLRPVAWLKQWPSAAHLHQPKLKTLARGRASRGGRQEASSRAASSGRLARRRRDQCKGTSRGTHDASHDDRGQAGTRRAPACAGSLFPLWCKGGKHRPRNQAKVTIPVQRNQDQPDGGHRGAQDSVITSAFGIRRPPLVKITCTRCSPSKWPNVGVGVLGTGVPRLACLQPAAWLKQWPSAAHLHQLKLKTLARGQASWGGRHKASSGAASPGRLARRRSDQGRGTS